MQQKLLPLITPKLVITYHPTSEESDNWPDFFKLGCLGIVKMLFDNGATIGKYGFTLPEPSSPGFEKISEAYTYLRSLCYGGNELINELSAQFDKGFIDSHGGRPPKPHVIVVKG